MAEPISPLVVFDFDRSLCTEADTDDYVCEKLLPEITLREMCLKYLPGWHNAINHMLELIREKGLTTADIKKCLSSLAIPAAVVDTVRQLHEEHRYNIYILSDANTFWISEVLKSSNCDRYIDKVMTNIAKYDEKEDKLTIEPFYAGPPHGCPNPCGSNMCKGMELRKIVENEKRPRIIYVGDGKNDFCAAQKLRKGDLVFAREGFLLATKIRELAEPLNATVLYWTTPEDLVDLFHSQAMKN